MGGFVDGLGYSGIVSGKFEAREEGTGYRFSSQRSLRATFTGGHGELGSTAGFSSTGNAVGCEVNCKLVGVLALGLDCDLGLD
jgi:hypothetical protein